MSEEPGERPQSKPSAGGGGDVSQWYRLAGVGFEFVVAVALFGGIGWWLDRRFGTGPWLLLVGCLIGFAGGLYLMLRLAGRMFKD